MDFTWIANDQGDITGVTATSPLTGGGTSGAITVGIQDATTSVKGAVQLSDSTSTTSSVLASTPTATKSAYDLANTANTTANAAIAKTTVTAAGDIIYRNATVPTRLGIGTAGQVLAVNSGATAPEWIAPVSGGLTSIASGSLSGSTTTLGSISGSYKNLQLVLSGFYASNVDATMTFNNNSGTVYQYTFQLAVTNTITNSGGSFTKIYLHEAAGSTSDTTGAAVLNIYNYASATASKNWDLSAYYINNASAKIHQASSGGFASTTAITSIELTTPGTWSGVTYVLYGVK
jgi:hypothetical protein